MSGFGHDTEALARAYAKKALKRMRTKGWTIRTWDNLGWHWTLWRPHIQVRQGLGGTFSAGVSEHEDGVGTPAYWYNGNSYADPNKAVEMAVREAQKHVAECNLIIAQVVDLLPVTDASKILRQHLKEKREAAAREKPVKRPKRDAYLYGIMKRGNAAIRYKKGR